MNRTKTYFTALLVLAFSLSKLMANHINLPAADLQLIKTVDNPYPDIGDQVEFIVAVENEGPLDATGIIVHAYVKNGYENISNISNGGTLSGDTVVWSIDNLANQDLILLSYTVDVLSPGIGIDFDNTAEIFAMNEYDRDSTPGNGPDPDGNGLIGPLDTNPNDGSIDPFGEDDSDNEPVHPIAMDLALIKTVDNSTPFIGDTVNYTITVFNDGPDVATGVAVDDLIPSGLVNIHDISHGGQQSLSTIQWVDLGLDVNDTIRLTYSAEVGDSGEYTNLAEISAANEFDIDSTPGNGADTDGDGDVGPLDDDGSQDDDDEDDGDDATLNPKRIDLELIKTVNQAIANPGDFVIFTITVNNVSDFDATGVEVTDFIPTGYGQIQNISDSGIINGSEIVWSNLDIDANDSASLSFEAEVLADGDHQNIAEITAADQNDIDSTPGNGADTDGDGSIGPLDDDGSQDPDDEDDGDDEEIIVCTLEITVIGENVLCYGDCTDLSISANTGSGTFSYNWNNGFGNVPSINACPDMTTTYAITVTDENNCVAIDSIIVEVICTDEPVLSVIDGLEYYDCDEEPNFGILEVDGGCEIISQVFRDSIVRENCPREIMRIWEVVDECNRRFTENFVVIAEDNLPPVLSDLPADIEIDCMDDLPVPAILTANDNCDPDVMVDFTMSPIPECNNGNISYIWTATDCSGNSIQHTQNILVQDNLAPSFDQIPADLTVSCDNIPGPQTPSILDNCDENPTLDFSEENTPGDCPNEQIILLKWIAADCSGNSDSIIQKITVIDTIGPIFTGIGNDTIVTCGDDLRFSSPTVTDNCGEVILEFYDRTTPLTCGEATTRKWTATDECGNVSTASQTITEIDTLGPTISNLLDKNFACDETPVFDTPQAQDNCTTADLTYADTMGEMNCAGTSVIRVWTATDACGNISTQSQTLVPIDTIAPVLSGIGPDGDYNCGQQPVFSDPQASDNCSSVEITFDDIQVMGSCTGIGVARVWTATDLCGNVSTAMQSMYLIDDESPTISGVGPDGEYECGSNPEFSSPEAMDDCTSASLEFEDIILSEGCAGNTIQRVWTATDDCGNTSIASQTMTAFDTIPPSFGPLSDTLYFVCGEIPFTPDVVVSDNCSEITIDMTESFGGQTCAGTSITFTWLATDECGNTAQISQTHVPTDDLAPEITGVGPDQEYSCELTPVFSDPIATDNCSAATLSFEDQIIDSNCAGDIIQRTWTAIDLCGNQNTASQTLTPIDTLAPSITELGLDSSYDCDMDPEFTLPVAIDECSDVIIDFEDNLNNSNCAGPTVERTWIITDQCGNSTTALQTMVATDTIAPVITGVGSDSSFDCEDTPVFSTPSATDNCSAVTLEFNDETTIDGDCRIVVTRSWTAIDACGNVSYANQSMVSIDNDAPVITGVGQDTTYECGASPIFSDPQVSDNCSGFSIEFTDTSSQNGCTTSITRLWTASDECGNISTASQTLSSTDDEAPEFMNAGIDNTYDCGSDPVFTEPDISDCTAINLDVSTETIEENCAGEVLKRTWTATDECGNVSSVSQTLTAIDTIKPVFSEIEENVVFPCGEEPPFADPTAIDNCSDVTITFVNYPGSRTCAPDGVMRIWTATDECGNSCTIVQTLTPIDTIPPVISGVGPGGNIECDEVPPFSNPTAEDECTGALLEFTDALIMDDCRHISITRNWVAEDACGNISTASETFYYSDTIAPVIEPYETLLVFNCDDDLVFPDLNANDQCSEVNVSFNDAQGDSNCFGNDIIRTWTFTDDCGNMSVAVQTATVLDEVPPIIDPIEDTLRIDCALPLEFSDIIANDDCSNVEIEFADTTVSGTCAGSGLSRVWTVSDLCGNTSTISQVIIPIDTIAPNLSDVGLDALYDCADDPVFSDPVVPDNCGNVNLIFEDVSSPGSCAGPGTTRIWTATDDCGNVSTASQTLIPSDTASPIISLTEKSVSMECGVGPVVCGDYNLSKISFDLNACRSFIADNSQSDYSEFIGTVESHIEGTQISGGILYRNNPVENPHSCTPGINATHAMCVDILQDCSYDPGNDKSIVIDVNIDPGMATAAYLQSLSFYQRAPEEFLFSHGPTGPNDYPTLYGIRILIDDTEVYRESAISTTREWDFDYHYLLEENIYSDSSSLMRIELLPYCAVGNGAVMSVWDVEQIEIVFADDEYMECANATDNCTDFTLEYSDSPSQLSCAGNDIQRTWIAIDECGNLGTAVQIINKYDNRPPVIIGVGNDGEYFCGEAPVFSEPYAIDECSTVNLSFIDESNDKITTRIWTAIDECGNIATASQSFEETDCIIDLELDKEADKYEVSLGDQIEFTIEVYNNSDYTAHNAVVFDKLSDGFYYLSHSTSSGVYNPITGLWYLGNVEGYETAQLTISAWVLNGEDYTNLASVADVDEKDVDSTPNNRVDTNLDGNFSDDPNDEDDGDGVSIEVQQPYGVRLYPQPATNMVTLDAMSYEEADISWQIFNSEGKRVLTSDTFKQAKGLNSYQIDVSGLASGTYVLRTFIGRHRVVKKLIVLD